MVIFIGFSAIFSVMRIFESLEINFKKLNFFIIPYKFRVIIFTTFKARFLVENYKNLHNCNSIP